MIGQYLSNTNENATVVKTKNFHELNRGFLVRFCKILLLFGWISFFFYTDKTEFYYHGNKITKRISLMIAKEKFITATRKLIHANKGNKCMEKKLPLLPQTR